MKDLFNFTNKKWASILAIALIVIVAFDGSAGSLLVSNKSQKNESVTMPTIDGYTLTDAPIPQYDGTANALEIVLDNDTTLRFDAASLLALVSCTEDMEEEESKSISELRTVLDASLSSDIGDFAYSGSGSYPRTLQSYVTTSIPVTTNLQTNIANYKAVNPDVIGWIYVPGTNINYPVCQTSDNSYYSTRDVYKRSSKMGTVYADFRCNLSSKQSMSPNTILYGHNWTNCSATPYIARSSDQQFAQLTGLQYSRVIAAHPYIYFSLQGVDMTFVIFANFYTNISFNYISPYASTISSVISGAKARSESLIGVDVNSSDKIITLSTCTRRFPIGNKQRFVVMARMLRPGESLGGITVSDNPNPVRP